MFSCGLMFLCFHVPWLNGFSCVSLVVDTYYMFYVIVSGEEDCLRRVRSSHDNKVMGLLITIRATYHAPFKTNKICGIGSNECSRYRIRLKIHGCCM